MGPAATAPHCARGTLAPHARSRGAKVAAPAQPRCARLLLRALPGWSLAGGWTPISSVPAQLAPGHGSQCGTGASARVGLAAWLCAEELHAGALPGPGQWDGVISVLPAFNHFPGAPRQRGATARPLGRWKLRHGGNIACQVAGASPDPGVPAWQPLPAPSPRRAAAAPHARPGPVSLRGPRSLARAGGPPPSPQTALVARDWSNNRNHNEPLRPLTASALH